MIYFLIKKHLTHRNVVAIYSITNPRIINISDIKPWTNMCKMTLNNSQFSVMPDLNEKVSLIQGSIVNIIIALSYSYKKFSLTTQT